MGHEPRLHGDPPRSDRLEKIGPSFREILVDLDEAGLWRLPSCLDRVPRVGEDGHLIRRDQELSGAAGDLFLALAKREPGQIAHVLAAYAEIGVDARLGETRPQPLEARRTRRTIGVIPGHVLCRCGRIRKVGRDGKPGHWM